VVVSRARSGGQVSPKICYVERRFNSATAAVIEHANTIIAEYVARGFDLTLRQLYYQFVSRDLLANRQSEYKRLGSIVNDARLAGLIDWDHITDRTRELRSLSHWSSPSDIVEAIAQQFRIDRWADQPRRVEVWIEKDALVGVFERVCQALDIGLFSCRGYTSQSEMWAAAQRLRRYAKHGQEVVILHFGDHDPSGLDMTRDITDRLALFGCDLDVRRLALTMDQVREYAPPPNPAKATDSRFAGYIPEYGDESWELDALSPEVLAGLVTETVTALQDTKEWAKSRKHEATQRELLQAVSDRWDDVADFVKP
jgi:hypothetical protein